LRLPVSTNRAVSSSLRIAWSKVCCGHREIASAAVELINNKARRPIEYFTARRGALKRGDGDRVLGGANVPGTSR
jgi:hypothetical protein